MTTCAISRNFAKNKPKAQRDRIVFFPLPLRTYPSIVYTERRSFSGRTSAFQADSEGSIPSRRMLFNVFPQI